MQQNYFENVKNWAHHLKEHWKETRSSIPAEQRIIIEEKLQQFERQLHEQTFENDEILYERAMNLYDSFRLFYHHSYVPIGQHRHTNIFQVLKKSSNVKNLKIQPQKTSIKAASQKSGFPNYFIEIFLKYVKHLKRR